MIYTSHVLSMKQKNCQYVCIHPHTHILGALTHLGVLVWGKSYSIHGHYLCMWFLCLVENILSSRFWCFFFFVNLYNIDWFLGNVQEGRKVHIIPGVKKRNKVEQVGHSSHILALAISTDSKFLVSAAWISFLSLFFLFSERKESVFKMLITL